MLTLFFVSVYYQQVDAKKVNASKGLSSRIDFDNAFEKANLLTYQEFINRLNEFLKKFDDRAEERLADYEKRWKDDPEATKGMRTNLLNLKKYSEKFNSKDEAEALIIKMVQAEPLFKATSDRPCLKLGDYNVYNKDLADMEFHARKGFFERIFGRKKGEANVREEESDASTSVDLLKKEQIDAKQAQLEEDQFREEIRREKIINDVRQEMFRNNQEKWRLKMSIEKQYRKINKFLEQLFPESLAEPANLFSPGEGDRVRHISNGNIPIEKLPVKDRSKAKQLNGKLSELQSQLDEIVSKQKILEEIPEWKEFIENENKESRKKMDAAEAEAEKCQTKAGYFWNVHKQGWLYEEYSRLYEEYKNVLKQIGLYEEYNNMLEEYKKLKNQDPFSPGDRASVRNLSDTEITLANLIANLPVKDRLQLNELASELLKLESELLERQSKIENYQLKRAKEREDKMSALIKKQKDSKRKKIIEEKEFEYFKRNRSAARDKKASLEYEIHKQEGLLHQELEKMKHRQSATESTAENANLFTQGQEPGVEFLSPGGDDLLASVPWKDSPAIAKLKSKLDELKNDLVEAESNIEKWEQAYLEACKQFNERIYASRERARREEREEREKTFMQKLWTRLKTSVRGLFSSLTSGSASERDSSYSYSFGDPELRAEFTPNENEWFDSYDSRAAKADLEPADLSPSSSSSESDSTSNTADSPEPLQDFSSSSDEPSSSAPSS